MTQRWVLVLNAGSFALKYQVVDPESGTVAVPTTSNEELSIARQVVALLEDVGWPVSRSPPHDNWAESEGARRPCSGHRSHRWRSSGPIARASSTSRLEVPANIEPAGTAGRTGLEAEEESCSQLECSWY